MADKKIQMTQRSADNTTWDNLYPKTTGDQVVASDGTTFQQHLDDYLKHVTPFLKKIKLNKDSNGIYTTTQYKRENGTLAIESIVSGGTSPQYTTWTIKFYDVNGTTVLQTITRTIAYDSDGNVVSEL